MLVSPAAIRTEAVPPLQNATPEERLQLHLAHHERESWRPSSDPAVVAKQSALTRRVMGPDRDELLETQMAELQVPTLVLFGTLDRITPPELGRFYRQLLPRCSLMLVYDAAHEIDADRPEAFVDVVSDFLTRHEGFLVKEQSSLINP